MPTVAGSAAGGLRHVITTHAVAVAVPVAGWWALFGWDTTKTLGRDGRLQGSYESRQVVALVIVLGPLAAWLGHRRRPLDGSAYAAGALAISFGVSADLAAENDGMWPIAAAMLFVLAFAGMVLVGVLTRSVGERRRATQR